jgi:signal transduction histidine kinase
LIVMKKRDLTLVPMSVKRIVAEVRASLKPHCQGRHTSAPVRRTVMSLLEPDLVKSIIINLADNARKALDTGGQILIESKTCPTAASSVWRTTGRGIPESSSFGSRTPFTVWTSRARGQARHLAFPLQ